jgi:hypothetical protein
MTTPEVYKGITAVTRALGRAGIGKDRKNLQQNYNFRGIDDIYNALSNELATAQLCIIPRVISREAVERQGRSGGALFYVTIHAEYDVVSAIDGSRHTASAYGEAMDSGDKATNKAMSAAYKYMAMQLFCIPTEGDNDADATTHEVRGASYQPAAPPQTNGNGHTTPGNASEKQVRMLFAIWKKSEYEGDLREWVATTYGCKVDELTIKQASEAIETLQPKDTPA